TGLHASLFRSVIPPCRQVLGLRGLCSRIIGRVISQIARKTEPPQALPIVLQSGVIPQVRDINPQSAGTHYVSAQEMHTPMHWSSLSQDRRSAFVGAALWGILGAALLAFSSDGWLLWIGSVLLLVALVLAGAGATASDSQLRRVLGLASWPWPL